MDGYMTLILLSFGCSFSSCSKSRLREYYYVNLSMNWTDAQDYCRVHYTDLATFESMDDIRKLKADFHYNFSWVGLRDDPKSWKNTTSSDPNSWRWSATGEMPDYQAWYGGEPNNSHGNESCTLMNTAGKWNDYPCQGCLGFVCYNVTNQNNKTYNFIASCETWNFSLEYCREHHTDLAMIHTEEENSKVFSAITGSADAWIGLYRVPWTWSDSSQSSFRNWKAGKPDNRDLNQHCAAEDDSHEWHDVNCQNKNQFICHGVAKFKTMVRLRTKTNADMTDPAIQAQILQQFGAALTNAGVANVTLRWKMVPKKQKKR